MTESNNEKSILPAIATMYRAAVSFGTQESQLVWTRYAGFIVINGFLINAVTKRVGLNYESTVLLAVGIIGLLINLIWHVLNFAGWQNQNLWYCYASGIVGQFNDKPQLPTDEFKDVIAPFGPIYWVAQSIPTLFAFGASLSIYFGLLECGGASCIPVIAFVGAFIVGVTIALTFEYAVIAPRGAKKKPS